MFGSGREALLDVRELLEEPPGWLGVVGGPYKYLGVVRRPSWMSETGRKTLPDVREWSGGHLGCPRVVGWPSRISGNRREAPSEV